MATAPQTLHRSAMVHHWQGQVTWIVGAGVIGFAMSEIFTSILQVSREWWVAAYAPVVALMIYAYCRWTGIEVIPLLRRHVVEGVVVGAAFAALISFLIVRTQAASPRDAGLTFVWDIVWLGIVYGLADALLLNVLPVYATWHASKELGHTDTWAGKIGTVCQGLHCRGGAATRHRSRRAQAGDRRPRCGGSGCAG